jgi:hypothetical protein
MTDYENGTTANKNIATSRAGRYKISRLEQYLFVVRQPKQHPTQIQTNMTLPTRPHAIFSIPIAIGTSETLTQSQPCKIVKNADTQLTHPG